MKIVINKCYGGFGLSAKAVKRYAELAGHECYFFKYGVIYSQLEPYVHITVEEAQKEQSFTAFTTPNPNAFMNPYQNEEYKKYHIDHRQYERTDPLLIQVIEELKKTASGYFADLHIIEIPDDVEWEIEEYDGIEWVAEKHRTWR